MTLRSWLLGILDGVPREDLVATQRLLRDAERSYYDLEGKVGHLETSVRAWEANDGRTREALREADRIVREEVSKYEKLRNTAAEFVLTVVNYRNVREAPLTTLGKKKAPPKDLTETKNALMQAQVVLVNIIDPLTPKEPEVQEGKGN